MHMHTAPLAASERPCLRVCFVLDYISHTAILDWMKKKKKKKKKVDFELLFNRILSTIMHCS